MSRKISAEDLSEFSECENEIVGFESTWSLERFDECSVENTDKMHSLRNCSNIQRNFYFDLNLVYFRVYDKANPIPTQTEPVNKNEDKSTNVHEVKNNSVNAIFLFFICSC